ncbi:MAG: type II toxin-antitoxin system RelE/ParE family toxin [Defluviitaleaceae bacterium]|nr:type II toxin-antitoxin system RelE/ParE family toxin [Defluviitaleaceae bacterium]
MTPLYSKQAAKYLDSLDASTQKRIRNGINGIPAGDIKMLSNCIGDYRLRIGGWRIIFSRIDVDTILIIKIASRGQVYKGVR